MYVLKKHPSQITNSGKTVSVHIPLEDSREHVATLRIKHTNTTQSNPEEEQQEMHSAVETNKNPQTLTVYNTFSIVQ